MEDHAVNHMNSLSDYSVNTQSEALEESIKLGLQKARSGCVEDGTTVFLPM